MLSCWTKDRTLLWHENGTSEIAGKTPLTRLSAVHGWRGSNFAPPAPHAPRPQHSPQRTASVSRILISAPDTCSTARRAHASTPLTRAGHDGAHLRSDCERGARALGHRRCTAAGAWRGQVQPPDGRLRIAVRARARCRLGRCRISTPQSSQTQCSPSTYVQYVSTSNGKAVVLSTSTSAVSSGRACLLEYVDNAGPTFVRSGRVFHIMLSKTASGGSFLVVSGGVCTKLAILLDILGLQLEKRLQSELGLSGVRLRAPISWSPASRSAKYSCASASSPLQRRPGSNASMRSSRCTAGSPAGGAKRLHFRPCVGRCSHARLLCLFPAACCGCTP